MFRGPQKYLGATNIHLGAWVTRCRCLDSSATSGYWCRRAASATRHETTFRAMSRFPAPFSVGHVLKSCKCTIILRSSDTNVGSGGTGEVERIHSSERHTSPLPTETRRITIWTQKNPQAGSHQHLTTTLMRSPRTTICPVEASPRTTSRPFALLRRPRRIPAFPRFRICCVPGPVLASVAHCLGRLGARLRACARCRRPTRTSGRRASAV